MNLIIDKIINDFTYDKNGIKKPNWIKIIISFFIFVIAIVFYPIGVPLLVGITVFRFTGFNYNKKQRIGITTLFVLLSLIVCIAIIPKQENNVKSPETEVLSQQDNDSNGNTSEVKEEIDLEKQTEEKRIEEERKRQEEIKVAEEKELKAKQGEQKKQENIQKEQQINTAEPTEDMVYCNSKSKIYHTIPNCKGMTNAIKMTKNKAESSGYRACRLKGGCRSK